MSEGGGALREIAARFGIEFDDKQLKQGVQSVGGAIDRIKEFGQLLAANELVQRVREFANQFAADAQQIRESAQSLRVAAVDLQAFSFAAQESGLNAAQASAALGTFSEVLRNATRVGAQQFRSLGVAIRGADGAARPMQDVLDDVAGALGRIENPARRAMLAKRYFGENARLLLPILRDGKGGLAALRDEFEALGGGVSQEAIEVAREYSNEMRRQQLVADGWRATIATALLPWITEGARRVRQWTVGLMMATRQSEAVRAVLIVLGATAAAVAIKVMIAWGPMLLVAAKFALIIASLVLIVDDLLVTIAGGDSMTRRFLDGMLGVGATVGVINGLKEGWEALKFIIGEVAAWGSRVWRELGDNLTYAQRWFGELFASIDRWFSTVGDGMFAGIWRSFTGFFRSVGSALARIPGMSSLSNMLSEMGQNIRMAYNLPSGQTQRPTVPGNQRATARAPAVARSTTVQQTNSTTINVQGAGDPAAVAREVERRQRDTQASSVRAAVGALSREAP